MACRRIGDKPLSEPMMTQFNDAYMRHSASMRETHLKGLIFKVIVEKWNLGLSEILKI